MKQDQWTQQLHEKLAEHETAAPEGLWADIEAVLDQQQAVPAQQQAVPAQQQATRSRFVALRRWAVAASIAALLFGGGYLWWGQQNDPLLTDLKGTPSFDDADGALLQSAYLDNASPVGPADTTAIERRRFQRQLAEESQRQLAEEPRRQIAEERQLVEEPQHQLAEERQQAENGQLADEPQHQLAEEPQHQLVDEPQRQIAENPQRQIAEQPQRQMADDPIGTSSMLAHRASPVAKTKPQPTLGLYAMNGLDNQNSSNGVQMADALAQQYMDMYANSFEASARSSEPIYLAGYEEQQHHHRPITYGLTLNYPLSDRLSLTTGIVYTKLQSDFTQMIRSQQIQQEQTLHYVGIPLGLSYRLWMYKSFRTYLSAGAKADWNVATHLETEGVSQHLPKDRLQWSLNTSLGLQYDILPQLGFYVEPSLNWYPDNGSAIQNYFKDKPLNLGLQIGLRYTLQK